MVSAKEVIDELKSLKMQIISLTERINKLENWKNEHEIRHTRDKPQQM
jgi:hypothetical protein